MVQRVSSRSKSAKPVKASPAKKVISKKNNAQKAV